MKKTTWRGDILPDDSRIRLKSKKPQELTYSRPLNVRSVSGSTQAKKTSPRASNSKQRPIKRAKPTTKRLKAKAWALFSEYVRRRCARPDGLVECVTCGVWRKWNDGMQAGHFIDGRSNAVLFDERITWPQCYACNCPLHGNKFFYTRFMEKQLGSAEAVDALVRELKNKTIQRKEADYLALIEEYQLKIEALK